jgi:hypothetical protein
MVTASIRTQNKVSQPHKYSSDSQAKITFEKTTLTWHRALTISIYLILKI